MVLSISVICFWTLFKSVVIVAVAEVKDPEPDVKDPEFVLIPFKVE